MEKICSQTVEITSELLATPLEHARDEVKIPVTALGSNRLKETLEDSAKRWRQIIKATPSRRA
ncbi:hypothetical protein Tco_0397417, partial [Tanacetum coccineum]